jgi:ABC-type antimicrobial peptide transport system permease subunit
MNLRLKRWNSTNPIGKIIKTGNSESEIIGVVNDFQLGSVHHIIEPLVFRFRTPGVATNVLVKVKQGTEQTVIKRLEQYYKKFHPNYPFEFSFLDSDYRALYAAEERVGTLSRYFAGLAIIISCLGLFGLASVYSSKKTKGNWDTQSGWRDSQQHRLHVIQRLFKTCRYCAFNCIPLGWWAMSEWLQSFAYRTDIGLLYLPLPVSLFIYHNANRQLSGNQSSYSKSGEEFENGIISVGNKQIKAGGQFIGKDYFNIFSCTFINGDKKDIQRDKFNIAISDELANTLFGAVDNVIGKTIEWNYGQFNGTYKITGIFKKLPKNTTDPFDLLLNYELFLEKRPWMQDWGNSDPSTFIVLKEGTDIQQVNAKIKNFLHSKNKDLANTLFAQRYSDRYLYGTYENGVVAGGRISYVRLFTLIAVFILLIACINFMNLSTAKALRRIKEVGIKKASAQAAERLFSSF